MPRSYSIKVATRTARPGVARLLVATTLLCGSAGLRAAHADNMVTDWNNEFLLITQQTSGNLVAGPPDVAREIAQIGAAMSDAVNAATGSTISSFAYTGGSMANANANVAAATAAYTALSNIFTDQVWTQSITSLSGGATTGTSNVTLGTLVTNELNAFFNAELSSQGLTSPGTTCMSSSSALCNGYNLGLAAATAVNNSASFSPVNSGAVASIINGLTRQTPAGSGTTPGVYVPPAARPEMFPTWGGTTPTGITSAQLNSALTTINGPPAVNSLAYAMNLLETQCKGAKGGFDSLSASVQSACTAAGFTQTAAQATATANAALFWNDPGTTIQPPGHWLQIADTAMVSQNSSLLQSAQLTALVGEAMNDAGIAAWGQKYASNLWRPITAITTNCNIDGTVAWSSTFTTCDASWSSLIATPPHPDYVAGHPAFSGAAATVLADFFGTDKVTFASTSNYYCNGASSQFDSNNLLVSCTVGATVYHVSNAADCAIIVDGANSNGSPLICPITETFSSFSTASSGLLGSEFSRVAGGIHTPFAVVDALTIGNTIGQALASNAGLIDVVPEPSSLSICAVSLLALTRLRRRRQATRA